jgi:hypothetical protein
VQQNRKVADSTDAAAQTKIFVSLPAVSSREMDPWSLAKYPVPGKSLAADS